MTETTLERAGCAYVGASNPAPVVPDGWVLVPKESTWDIREAFLNWDADRQNFLIQKGIPKSSPDWRIGENQVRVVWKTMLANASYPQPMRTKSEVRNAALEEAAELCGRYNAQCAGAIRALKTKEEP